MNSDLEILEERRGSLVYGFHGVLFLIVICMIDHVIYSSVDQGYWKQNATINMVLRYCEIQVQIMTQMGETIGLSPF